VSDRPAAATASLQVLFAGYVGDTVASTVTFVADGEVRVVVDPGEVDDERAAMISHEISAAIEKEMEYPGRIKITVIRESRSTSYAG
jgi:ribonuclease Y